jgi:hypothetical protein
MITFTKATTLNFCYLSIIWTCDNFIYGIMVVFVSCWNLFFNNICRLFLAVSLFIIAMSILAVYSTISASEYDLKKNSRDYNKKC